MPRAFTHGSFPRAFGLPIRLRALRVQPHMPRLIDTKDGPMSNEVRPKLPLNRPHNWADVGRSCTGVGRTPSLPRNMGRICGSCSSIVAELGHSSFGKDWTRIEVRSTGLGPVLGRWPQCTTLGRQRTNLAWAWPISAYIPVRLGATQVVHLGPSGVQPDASAPYNPQPATPPGLLPLALQRHSTHCLHVRERGRLQVLNSASLPASSRVSAPAADHRLVTIPWRMTPPNPPWLRLPLCGRSCFHNGAPALAATRPRPVSRSIN